MTTQSEQTLENNLIAQLVDMGYESNAPLMIVNWTSTKAACLNAPRLYATK